MALFSQAALFTVATGISIKASRRFAVNDTSCEFLQRFLQNVFCQETGKPGKSCFGNPAACAESCVVRRASFNVALDTFAFTSEYGLSDPIYMHPQSVLNVFTLLLGSVYL